ncbi:hypothetical protein [Actinospica robiniae]|nr:hypothetical protein [Actinospica robiniae]
MTDTEREGKIAVRMSPFMWSMAEGPRIRRRASPGGARYVKPHAPGVT